MATDELLTNYLLDEQLAKACQKSVRTIKRWRREGRAPPSIRWGNIRLTHVDDAAAHLEAKRQEACAGNGAKRRAR